MNKQESYYARSNTKQKHRVKIPRPVVSALAWQAPYALTVAVPRTRLRDAGVYLLQMLAYVAHYEMPNDDPAFVATLAGLVRRALAVPSKL